jgi:hypothetical protein
MSGGHFDYKQHSIDDIADSIESEILFNTKKKTKEDLIYSPEVLKEFDNAIGILRKAAIYAQRIDWLLSGDDGEETFIERLNDELNAE